MILFIICAAWISGPLLLLGVLWIQYYSWTWFHVWLLVPAFRAGNMYGILAGTAIWSRHVFTPDMALSSELSVSSWAFMDSHVLAYLFCWQMHKSECLGNPIVVFAWIFYVFRTEPASNFLYSLYRVGFDFEGQGSPYFTPDNGSCYSQKSTMPGKCKARNFVSALFVQKLLILAGLDPTFF